LKYLRMIPFRWCDTQFSFFGEFYTRTGEESFWDKVFLPLRIYFPFPARIISETADQPMVNSVGSAYAQPSSDRSLPCA